MLSFNLTEEQEMIRQMARNFAKKEILPAAEHYDQSDEFPWPIIRKAQKIGLISSNVPEEYGGPGLGVLEECIINEELAWACSGVQTVIMLNNLAAWPIILAGSADQKERYLPRLTDGGQLAAYALTEPAAGSDVAGILSTAVRQGDEYILNGTKTWITNAPVASFFIIFAKTDPAAKHRGMSAFIVEREWPGVTCGKPIPKMGQHAAWTGEIVLEDVRVPAENRLGNDGDGFLIAMKVFDRSRPPVAAAAVGVARRALDEATRYAQERKAFGKPIIGVAGHRLHAGGHGDQRRGGRAPRAPRRLAGGQRPAQRQRGGHGEGFCGRYVHEGHDRRRPGLRRLRLQPRVSGGKADARRQDLPDLRGHQPDSAGDYRRVS